MGQHRKLSLTMRTFYAIFSFKMKEMYMDRALLKEVVLEQKQAQGSFDLGINKNKR